LDADPKLTRTVRAWTREDGYHAMLAVLEAGIWVDAVVAGNDLLALGALAALQERGLAVPEQSAVVGWGGTPAAARASPSLPSLAPDLDALIAAALAAAVAASGPQAGAETVIEHQLIRRGSTPSGTLSSRQPRLALTPLISSSHTVASSLAMRCTFTTHHDIPH